ncbi:acetyl-coenzyme A synthetase N-terminal domain-containing protein [Bacterioplanoides pacificum]|uniref:Acetyl-coenzyme A synthetase N-terminal domain-containing protein n=1 Tax=Bacterioplanoides pacificum TaxID=1171596 RepID=A0ABV7VQ05_9GAMM
MANGSGTRSPPTGNTRRHAQIEAQTPYDSVLTNGDKMPGARWFEGAKLNFAENLLVPGMCPDLPVDAGRFLESSASNGRTMFGLCCL